MTRVMHLGAVTINDGLREPQSILNDDSTRLPSRPRNTTTLTRKVLIPLNIELSRGIK